MKVNKTIDAEFFFGATPAVFERSRVLRNDMTKAEKNLWTILNNRQVFGLHFRRQHPINKFIADFYYHKVRLVIEVDGEIHNTDEQIEYDESRNYFMNDLGLIVLRFTNEQVMKNLESVDFSVKEQVRKLLVVEPI